MTKPTVDELRARVSEKGPWFEVPGGTPQADCARCDAEYLYWIVTPAGKRMLVDCGVPGGVKAFSSVATREQVINDESVNGRGVSHFATCPDAPAFRRRT